MFWSLSPLPDTWSVFWRRVGVPNAKHKHSHSRLFQAPLPILDEIRGIEMPVVDSCGSLNDQILTLSVPIFLKCFILWEVEETSSGLRHIAKITVISQKVFCCSRQRHVCPASENNSIKILKLLLADEMLPM